MGLGSLLMIPGLGSNQPSLLDSFGGAAAAYSVRRVRAGYSGQCFRVRRSSDSTEADVGFSNGILDAAFLLAFVGAGDGFVTTLYDQTGNGNHLTQETALAQPRVVISGSAVAKNGKPAIDFTASQFLRSTIAGLSGSTAFSNFCTIAPNAAAVADGTTMLMFSFGAGGADNSNRGLSMGSVSTSVIASEKFGVYFSNASINAARLGSTAFSNTAGQQLLLSAFALSSGTSVFSNSSSITLNLANNMTTATDTSPANDGIASDAFRLNSIHNVGGTAAQCIQESIVYLSDQSSNRSGIESNINSFFTVY